MTRIFSFLALLALASVAGVLMLGLTFSGLTTNDLYDLTIARRLTVHRLSGVAAGLVVLLVESIVVTYFIGTGRWCKEVVETYQLAQEFVRRSTRLKRKTFPVAVMSMLVMVGMVALGGAADPGAALQVQPPAGVSWSILHLWGALIGTALIAGGFYREWNLIHANQQVISDVLVEVRRIRLERGLDVPAA